MARIAGARACVTERCWLAAQETPGQIVAMRDDREDKRDRAEADQADQKDGAPSETIGQPAPYRREHEQREHV